MDVCCRGGPAGRLVNLLSENDSWSKTGGQIVGGLIPIYGQVADARDTAAALRDVWRGEAGDGVTLGAALIGWVPLVGDSAKSAIKAGRKILKESADEFADRAVTESAERLAREATPEARAVLEQSVRAEAAERYAVKELEIGRRMDELAAQGHGPQRHGSHLTEQQLEDRAVRGFDPITGTTNDAYNKYPDGTPKPHGYSKNATKITSDEAYVEAERDIRDSQSFRDAVADADAKYKNQIELQGTSLQDIFGPTCQDCVFGRTRLGSKNNPTGAAETDFTDGTMTAVYRKDPSGLWNLITMYPEPKH